MDRCPRIIGTDSARVCRGQMSFYHVTFNPVWTRWAICDVCQGLTAMTEKGGLIGTFISIPKEAEIRPYVDDEQGSDFDDERPDSVQRLPKVQSKRVGGPIGRYQL